MTVSTILTPDPAALVCQYSSRPDLDQTNLFHPKDICRGRIQEIRSFPHYFPFGSFIQKVGGNIAAWTDEDPAGNYDRLAQFEGRITAFFATDPLSELTSEELTDIDLEECALPGDLGEINALGMKILEKRDRALVQFFEWMQALPGMERARIHWLSLAFNGKADAIREFLRVYPPLLPPIPPDVIKSWELVPMELLTFGHNEDNAALILQEACKRLDVPFLIALSQSGRVDQYPNACEKIGATFSKLLRRDSATALKTILQTPHFSNSQGLTPLVFGLSEIIKKGHIQDFGTFKELDPFHLKLPPNSWLMCLQDAAEFGRLSFAEFLLPYAMVEDNWETFSKTILSIAIRRDQPEMVSFLAPNLTAKALLDVLKMHFGYQALVASGIWFGMKTLPPIIHISLPIVYFFTSTTVIPELKKKGVCSPATRQAMWALARKAIGQ